MDERKAVRALKLRDAAALEWLIERYAGYINTITYNIIGQSMTESDIEEVVSDVFLALWNNSEKVTVHKLRAYLGSIARNRAKNKLREKGIDLPIEDDMVLISDATPESAVIAAEQSAIIRQAIFALGYPDREIFLRHYYYYQGVAQIAEEMDINASTVKTRLARGRRKLKEAIGTGGDFDGNKNS